MTTTANCVGGAQAAVHRPAREAVAHSAGRAQPSKLPSARRCTGTLCDNILGICAHSVLAASLRSALRIRCWCCTTDVCLCYLRWCRQHCILMLFQDNGTRLRQAGRLRQISQDSTRASRRLPGPQTRVSCCTFRAAYARSSPFTRCAPSSLPSCMSS